MRQKHLESALSSVQREFPCPDVTLEQYPTSPHLTSAVILTALENNDIGPGRTVLDLGCGTGILSLGCALVDTDHVIGVDCDKLALEQAITNAKEMELDDEISFILAKVPDNNTNNSINSSPATEKRHRGRQNKNSSTKRRGGGRGRNNDRRVIVASNNNDDENEDNNNNNNNNKSILFPLKDCCVDTVITNPPFGTKPDKAGIDIQFLKLACQLAKCTVYSFHKSATREYIIRTAQTFTNVANVTVIAQMKFDLPRTYKFHQQKSVDIEVDLIRIELIGKRRQQQQQQENEDKQANLDDNIDNECIGSDDDDDDDDE